MLFCHLVPHKKAWEVKRQPSTSPRPLATPVDYRHNQAVEAKTRYLKRWGLENPPLIPGETLHHLVS